MTDVMVGLQQTVYVDEGLAAGRVLGLLTRISVGEVESSREISSAYSDVDVLVARAEAASERFAEIGVAPSPFLVHLKKLSEIEQEINQL